MVYATYTQDLPEDLLLSFEAFESFEAAQLQAHSRANELNPRHPDYDPALAAAVAAARERGRREWELNWEARQTPEERKARGRGPCECLCAFVCVYIYIFMCIYIYIETCSILKLYHKIIHNMHVYTCMYRCNMNNIHSQNYDVLL